MTDIDVGALIRGARPERELNERVHANPDRDQQPELTYTHDDSHPNAAWEYAHRRSRGWGVWSEGEWLKSLDDDGPHWTSRESEARCFNVNEGAKRLGLLVLRHQFRNNIQRRVYVHLIPRGGR